MRSQSKEFMCLYIFILLLLQLQFVISVEESSTSSTTYNLSHHHNHHHAHHVECKDVGQKCHTDEQQEGFGENKRKIHTGPNPLHN